MVTFNITSETLEHVARELYLPAHCGAVSLLDAIPFDFRERLLDQLRSAPFERAPPFYGNTRQDFLRFSNETHPLHALPSSLDALTELATAHRQLYAQLGAHAGFDDELTLTYSAHHYPFGSSGLGSHRDESKYRNIIAVYVILGDRAFNVADNRDLVNCVSIPNPAGSIILMRAPRTDGERKSRPYHAVGNPITERYSVLFRHEANQ